jgi:hypothetical protein
MSGFTACVAGRTPPEVALVKGEPAGVRSQGDSASTGPTGAAWIDSNGWRIRLARLQQPGKTIWVETEPPKAGDVIPVERYLVGVADAGAHGGRWVISLDSDFRKAVAKRDADALQAWSRIAAAARFFQAHAEWSNLGARSMLGVLSDYRGDNEFLSTEILNLAARQQISYRLLDKTRLTGVPPGLRAVLYADLQAPADGVRAAVMQFVEAGGLLIAGAVWGKAPGAAVTESPTANYSIHTAGRGRIAIGAEMSDPYVVAQDAQILLSHRYDPIRVWNGGSLQTYVTGDERRALVHLVNYTGRASRDALSIKVMGPYSRASLHTFDAPPAPLEAVKQKDGLEVHLPRVAVYAAVECS